VTSSIGGDIKVCRKKEGGGLNGGPSITRSPRIWSEKKKVGGDVKVNRRTHPSSPGGGSHPVQK